MTLPDSSLRPVAPASEPRPPASAAQPVPGPVPPLVSPPPDRRRATLILVLGSLGAFMVFLDTTIVNIAFETISHGFHTTTDRLAWALNAYSVCFAAVLIPAGRLADRYGRKRVFLTGLAGFGVMSALCGMSPDAGVLIAGRALQGSFAALVVPSSLALILPEFPGARRHVAVGTWGAMSAAAAACGPTIGALLIEYGSWRWVFLVNVPIAIAAIVAGLRLLHDSRDPHAAGVPDPLGIGLVALIPAALSFSIIEGPKWGWSDPRVIAGFVLGAALVPAFVWRTRRAANPVMDLALYKDRQFGLVNAATLVFGTGFYAMLLANLLFMQTVWHYSVLRSALAAAPGPIVVALVARSTSKLSGRIGHRRVLMAGAVVWAIGMTGYATQVGPSPHWLREMLPYGLLGGLAIGMTLPVQSAAAVATLPPPRYALGSAINASFRQLGAVIGISVLVAILGTPSPATALDAFRHVWWTLGALGLASGAIQLLPTRSRAARSAAAQGQESEPV
jgi:EmrB/QacA subfamily drug resistance transporter